MPDLRYSHNESLMRIYDAMRGVKQSDSTPGVIKGVMEAWDYYLSKLAQMLENSSTSDYLGFPGSEYGGIYCSGVSAGISPAVNTWTKLTGTFQGDMSASSNITPDWNDDRMTISRKGVYFVGYSISFSAGVDADVHFAPYVGGTLMQTARSVDTTPPSGVGTVGHLNIATGGGLVNITTVPAVVDLRFSQTVTGTVQATAASLYAYNVGLLNS